MVIERCARRIRTRRLLLAVGACGAVAGLGVLALFPPTVYSFYPGCMFHQCTGLHCPGCGLTRAVHSLLNGRIEQAIAYNGIGLILVSVVALSMVRSLWSWACDERVGERPRRISWPWWAKWVIGGFMILYGVARNVPIEPFTALAPHELKPPATQKSVDAGDPPS